MNGKATECTEDTEGGSSRAERAGPFASLLHEELTGTIRQAAFEVHRYLGPGFLESVYQNALRNRLVGRGLTAGPAKFVVRDEDGAVIGVYVADLVVQGLVIVEIKAMAGLHPDHRSQLLNYLRAAGLRVGVLVNFGRPTLQFKRFVT